MTPRQRLLVRRSTKRVERDPSETEGELNIVPLLDIVVNLMLFLLATTAATMSLAEVDVELPSTCSTGNCQGEPSIGIHVTLAERGVIVGTRHGVVAPGCGDDGGGHQGVTMPRVPTSTGTNYDYAEVSSCLAALHARHPEETSVVVSADPEVEYQALVSGMDAIREHFEQIQLSAGAR